MTIPVYLKKIKDKPDFYDTYKGPVETVVRYREFFDETSKLKAELINFPPLLKGSNATMAAGLASAPATTDRNGTAELNATAPSNQTSDYQSLAVTKTAPVPIDQF